MGADMTCAASCARGAPLLPAPLFSSPSPGRRRAAIALTPSAPGPGPASGRRFTAKGLSPCPAGSARPTPAVRLQAGYDGVADFHAASIDPVDLMLRATAALRKTRTHPPRSWLRGFDEDEVAPEPT